MSWTPQASSEEAQTKVWEEVRKSTEEDDYRYGDLLLGWEWRSRKQVLVWFCLAGFFCVLRIEPKASYVLGSCSAILQHLYLLYDRF
jgi:hypothetical protein